jgi:hypothetical protein
MVRLVLWLSEFIYESTGLYESILPSSGLGLRTNVDITGTTNGLHSARINVPRPSGETLYYEIELTSADLSMLYYFYPGVIPNG